jgi:type II secretory pathway pseudopilin PulG
MEVSLMNAPRHRHRNHPWARRFSKLGRTEGRDEAGDTLVEVLITLVVIGLAGISIIGAFTMTINATADYRNVATLNTVVADASQNAISEIQQQTSPLYFPCATRDAYNSGSSAVDFKAPTGYTVTVTDVQFLNGTGFSHSCTPGQPNSTSPQQIFATATQRSTGASASFNFVVDDRGGTLIPPLPASIISITSTAPTSAVVMGPSYRPSATATSGDSVVITVDASSNGGCTISGGRVSFVAVGTCTLDFNDAGNASYSAAAQVSQSFSVAGQNNVITVTSTTPSHAVGGGSYTPSASATSGDTVIISIDAASSACSLSGGLVSFAGVGTCIVDFNDPGNSTFAAALQAQQAFSVSRSNTITITSTAPSGAIVGGPKYTPTATATSGDPVIISVDATSNGSCIISGGQVTNVTGGNCTLDFNDPGNVTYAPAPQLQQSFTIAKKANAITITSSAPSGAIVGGPKYTPSATALSGDPVAITVDASTSGNCTISGGRVSFTSAGTCTLDFNDSGSPSFAAAAPVQQNVNVGKSANAITVTSSAPNFGVVGGPTYTPSATALSGDTVAITVDFGSTNICRISGGRVSFIGGGSCTLDFNDTGNANFAAAPQVQQSFNVLRANVISITSTAPSNAVVGGSKYTPSATALSGDSVVITVDASSNGSCTISGGQVSFVTGGTCTLNFNDPGNANYAAANQLQQSFTVAKKSNLISITSTAPSNAMVGGSKYTPSATATSGDPVIIAIDASSNGSCTISGGQVSFASGGTCTLDFNDPGNASYAPANQLQQSFNVAKKPNVITINNSPTNPENIGNTYNPNAVASDGNTVNATLGAGDGGICTVNGGVITFSGSGTCTLLFNDSGNASYVAATQVTQTITVSKKKANIITIGNAAPNPAQAFTSYSPNASVSDGNTVTLTLGAGDAGVCSLFNNTRVFFWGSGTCTLLYNDPGNANYVAATQVTQSITVQ